jgi:2-keto-4-pentenoate hydratase/2-oxohepta-3-ene-1,7-dioic acid hydratase in catechol pathway
VRYCRIQLDGMATFVRIEKRDGVDWVAEVLEDQTFPEVCWDGLRNHLFFDPFPLADATLLCPVAPAKIICVGRNYRDHAAELGNEVPKEPLLFLKPPSSLLGPSGNIVYPEQSTRVDYEGELGIVIGKTARNIGPGEDVRQYIRGYTIVNDVTARDLQKTDGQWTRAKGFDTFCPVGPLVTDEIDPIADGIVLETKLNGETKQQGNTRDFIFGIPELLRYISAFLTLEPGDLIPTGTPAGVGPVQPGDSIEVSIAGIGTLVNTVIGAGVEGRK